MNQCPPKELLSGYVSGSATPEDSRRVEEHLSICAVCCAWCERASSNDDELLVKVRRAMDSTAAEPRTPSSEVRFTDAPAAQTPIAGYHTIKEIGRGGMGVVYLAVQESTKRQVALKVLLEGPFASHKARRRFEREVELAAQLDHPGIAAVLDSGLAQDRYYFAMRYVDGQRLDRYVTEQQLSLRDTLALFARVCDAVTFAHQHGVIHRDLKPSNILVTADGHPHILDFGLAKATAPAADDETTHLMISQPGELMGTLPFMSPEQTTGRGDVDIRSDVYALAVILYRLLLGKHPYPISGGVRETLRNIAEVDPPRPSSERADLNDEMDIILARAMAKDRDRRYPSVDQFAADIRAYLEGRPISAKRDHVAYVLRKAIARHRMAVVAGLALFVTSTIALTATVRQRGLWHQTVAREIVASFVETPLRAVSMLEAAPGAVRRRVTTDISSGVSSVAYTDRIVAARGGLLIDPASFWASVDGGPLWQNGEWLEVCDLPADIVHPLVSDIGRMAQHGSDRQRYAAWCLLGCMDATRSIDADTAAKSFESEQHPAVVAAARWALGRTAPSIRKSASHGEVDDVSGLPFVLVPATDSYVRGATADDPDRFADEAPIEGPISIPAFRLSATEVPYAAFQPFLADAAASELFGENPRSTMARHVGALSDADRPNAVAGLISQNVARQYCAWLTARGATAAPLRSYRLPTEAEWEYAARGGSSSRFCYGNDVKYAALFSNCDGRMADAGATRWHLVARHMPNFYGLFDMHGGQWEWTDSRYEPQFAAPLGLADKELWVVRGGASYSPALRCRSTQRNFAEAQSASDYHGLRIVMEYLP